MLEAYSLNIDVAEGTTSLGVAIPFNSISIEKGCTATIPTPSTIQLNRCGVYMVSVDASAEVSDDAGDISIQLTKNDVLQPQAQATETGETGDTIALSFVTLVQVQENNSDCCCASPVRLQVMNTGEAVTFKNVNCCVTKIC